nr:polyprotein [Ipomoea batatas]
MTEGEEGEEVAFGIVQESLHMITHQVIGSWRAHIDMSDVQKACRHQWQDHQEIEAPGKDTCLWCKHHINIRTRSHCPACLLTTCNFCSLRYLGREVPPKAQERPSLFPDQSALIQQQQLYMNWADQDRARLKEEVEDEKIRGQLLFEAERRRSERLGEEIAQQKLRIESMEEEQRLKDDLHAHTEKDLQKEIRRIGKLGREQDENGGSCSQNSEPTIAHEELNLQPEIVGALEDAISPQIVSSASGELNNRLYNMRVSIRIRGCPEFHVNAILDTGATVCCIEEARVPNEGLEDSRMIAQFTGLNSTQQTRKKLKEGYMIIGDHTFPLPFVYALNPMKIGRGIQFIIGCNFIRRMKGGLRIEGPTVTFYRNVSTIETQEKSTVAAAIGNINEERTMVFPRFRREVARLIQEGYIGDNPLKHWSKNKVECTLRIKNPDLIIQDPPLKHVTPAAKEFFQNQVSSLLKAQLIRPSKSRHRTTAFMVESGTSVDPKTGKEASTLLSTG